jgi:hypothetical protein
MLEKIPGPQHSLSALRDDAPDATAAAQGETGQQMHASTGPWGAGGTLLAFS